MYNNITYSIVVPLYNEELVIDESYSRLKNVMDTTCENYEIIFINDGSYDSTREKAESICEKDKNIKLINFSRNFGHQCAITAGMENTKGAAVIVIDADLQDPPEVMLDMIKKWKEGYDVVYGQRSKREGESFFKKFTAKSFYRLLKSMTNVDIPVDTGDFRLIDRKVCNTLNSLPERNRYVRGLVSWVGYKQTSVEFERKERFAGESKYPLKKMMKLALDGITSFSYKPLIMSGYIGGLSLFIGIFSMIADIVKHLMTKTSIINFGFIIALDLSMFGITLTCMSIIGQYIGRIFDESRERPNYIIESIITNENLSKKHECVK
ncbi:dolichol-phosphate mannosyltransferase [Clostridium algifaecis]|uniref:Dolichol-phosphate mannosyltransferase n=1 Tax=Clostridium algifaecis TaxID=1472040 RepID=A0ABS4KYA8_9CLOT|nr:glycosyltransferase family 2 protein [Clostridium algifaecis]MBP2033864.1 dolichol-phosphate mannosyltransferase [Clostridium algifaecis]